METLNVRTATKEDFIIGVTLIDKNDGYAFTILRKYVDGIWEARGARGQGDKCVFEGEARFYNVELKPTSKTPNN